MFHCYVLGYPSVLSCGFHNRHGRQYTQDVGGCSVLQYTAEFDNNKRKGLLWSFDTNLLILASSRWAFK